MSHGVLWTPRLPQYEATTSLCCHSTRAALVLSNPQRLLIPGRHEGEPEFAAALNVCTMKASEEWVVYPPGSSERVKEHIYAKYPWRRAFDARRLNAEGAAQQAT